MLFPYQHVPHSMEKMQDYINFIFYEVWCKANGKEYDTDVLFEGNEELHQIITELHTSEVKGADFFLTGLQLLFLDFQQLGPDDIDLMKLWYQSNNNIELLCDNDPTLTPATYEVIDRLSTDLSGHLKAFFKNLYSQSFLSLASISSRIGTIDEHYTSFMETNTVGKCPFCGVSDVKGVYHTKREAYDHYLPKAKYPFNSINFQNLVPACNDCNSVYKLAQDPTYQPKDPVSKTDGRRRKAFYPYSNESHEIEVQIDVQPKDWTQIKPNDINMSLGPESHQEQINTWLDVYGIEERYKAKCCGENDGLAWIQQMWDEWQEDGRSPEDFLKTLSRHADRKPFADENFLKRAFLDGCWRAGLFRT